MLPDYTLEPVNVIAKIWATWCWNVSYLSAFCRVMSSVEKHQSLSGPTNMMGSTTASSRGIPILCNALCQGAPLHTPRPPGMRCGHIHALHTGLNDAFLTAWHALAHCNLPSIPPGTVHTSLGTLHSSVTALYHFSRFTKPPLVCLNPWQALDYPISQHCAPCNNAHCMPLHTDAAFLPVARRLPRRGPGQCWPPLSATSRDLTPHPSCWIVAGLLLLR